MKTKTILILLTVFFPLLSFASGETNSPQKPNKGKYTFATEGAVDLGLPSGTLWAATNLGAKTPYDTGEIYAWGDTTPYSKINFIDSEYYEPWRYYRFYRIGGPNYQDKLTKYNTDNKLGEVDNKTVLEPEDDIATITLGDGWRLPTKAEIEELIEKCTWVFYNISPRKDKIDEEFLSGYIVVGPNGNAIFILSTAFCTSPDYCTIYWSSELSDAPTKAYSLYVDPYNNPKDSQWPDFPSYYVMRYDRATHSCIRPVKSK